MDTNNKSERHDDQLTPFTYGNQPLRVDLIDGAPWFVAKDVCDALGLGNPSETLNDFPQDEKGIKSFDTPGGRQYLLTVNEPGLYRLIFRSRKKQAVRFKTWVFTEVLPQIRKTGAYGMNEPAPRAAAGYVYSLFSASPDMTIQRVNKLVYYLAVCPPLSNADIAKLLDVSDSTATYWRKRLTGGMARDAVLELGIDATGHSANVPRVQPPFNPPCIAPELAEKEAAE